MDYLTLFGLFAVTAMLILYALKDRSAWFILAFAESCALGSIYGFLQGAWPFGVVEAIWALVAASRSVAVAVMWVVMVLVARGVPRANGDDSLLHDMVTRFMGLIVLAMGVQFALTGFHNFFS
jgi:hypothetical protein